MSDFAAFLETALGRPARDLALFERAVGLYAEMIDVNAYDQPGVEAGKRAAAGVLEIQRQVVAWLRARPGAGAGAREIAAGLGRLDEAVTVFRLLLRLAATPGRGVVRRGGGSPADATFAATEEEE